MLGMSRRELASATSVTPRTIADFERGTRRPHASTLRLLQSALEEAGIIFIDGDDTTGPGVQLRAPRK